MIEHARNTEFVSTLTDIRQGDLCHELNDDLVALVRTVQLTGKKGTMDIKLVVKPEGVGKVSIADSASIKMPKAETVKTVLFASESGQLLPNDPRQGVLPLNITQIAPRPMEAVEVPMRQVAPL